MRVIVSSEHRFDRTPDGTVWGPDGCSYRYWKRFLEVFDRVVVVARVREAVGIPPGFEAAKGEGVEFNDVPYYVGPWQFLWSWRRIVSVAQKAVDGDGAIIMRVPSPIAFCIYPRLRLRGQPYGVEVVSDPRDVFSAGAMRHPLRPFFRWYLSRQLRQYCRVACAAAYVTRDILQRRYPCIGYELGVSDVELSPQAFVTSYSNVDIRGTAFAVKPRDIASRTRIRIISIGSLEQMYKGPDVVIEAAAECVREGMDLSLTWIGDGRHRRTLEKACHKAGLGERVTFTGRLPAGEAVRAQLDSADLFVLASRAEGLPRAMIEAMARGVPCIGSDVGGIPELLPSEDLVRPGDVKALAWKIREVVTNPARMAQMSGRNLDRAQEYRDEVLHERRVAFYRYVREKTELWLKVKDSR